MIRKLPYLFITLFFTCHTYMAISRPITGPEQYMVGARSSAVGAGNPAISGDLNTMIINPATLGDIDAIPISFTSQHLMGNFDYSVVNFAFPMELKLKFLKNQKRQQRITLGMSYGSVNLGDIPETFLQDNLIIRQIGTYSAGYNIVNFSAGSSFYDIYGFNVISAGSSLKFLKYFVKDSSSSTFGINGGVLATKHIGKFFVERIHIGTALHNIIAPSFTYESGNEGLLPMTIYMGLKADLFEDRLSLFLNNGADGLSVGSEFIQNNLILRNSTNFKKINLGLGLLFDHIATGFGNSKYSLRFDYSYTHQLDNDLSNLPTHALSFSILGEARPNAPIILNPDQENSITQEKFTKLSGIGPKNTAIRIYNNNALVQTTLSDRFGNWKIGQVKLNEGKNNLYVKSFGVDQESSMQSNSLDITSDTIPPTLNIKVVPEKSVLKISIESTENIDVFDTKMITIVDGKQTENKIEFSPNIIRFIETGNERKKWTAETPIKKLNSFELPNQMMKLIVNAKDEAGNKVTVKEFPFFVSFSFPSDKTVHYKENIRFIGQSSDMVSGILINESPTYIDPAKRFTIQVPLNPGKNLIKVKVKTLNDQDILYSCRILRLKSYTDLTDKTKHRKEIEFMATLGILDGDMDGNFYPTKPVTRQYIAKVLYLISGETNLPKVTNSLFTDVPKTHEYAPYIQIAVKNGLMFALPDGSFKPDQSLTLSEVIFLLSNAGFIDSQEVEGSENKTITRAELAEFLAYTPKYEIKIESLIDWKKGYQ